MATTFEKIQTLLGRVKKNKEHKFYAESTLDDGRVIVTEEDALDIGVVVQVLEADGTSYPLEEGEYILADGTPLVITGDGVVANMGGGDKPTGAIKRKKDKKIADEKRRAEESERKAKDAEKKKPADKPRIPAIDDIKRKEEERRKAEDEKKKIDSPLPPKDGEKAPPKEAEKRKFETIEEEVYEEFEEIVDEDRAKEIIEFISTKLEEYIEEVEEEEEEIVEMENEKVEFSSVVGDLMTRIDELETKLSNIEKSPAEEGITLNPAGTDYSFSKPKDVYNNKISKSDVLNMTTSERAKFMIQNKLTRI